jgi:ABC-type methionine transport system permease subunit
VTLYDVKGVLDEIIERPLNIIVFYITFPFIIITIIIVPLIEKIIRTELT